MSPPLDPELARVGSGHSRSAETSAAAPVPSGWRVQSRLNLREDAHTSSSPATQDAWGVGLDSSQDPSPRSRPGARERWWRKKPEPWRRRLGGRVEVRPLGTWLPLAKVNQAAPCSGGLRAPGSGPSPGGCAAPRRALSAPPGRCSNPSRERRGCPGGGQGRAAGVGVGAAGAERIPPRDVLC